MNVKKYFTIVLVSVFICAAVFGGILFARFSVKPFESGEHGDAVSPVVGNKVNVLLVGRDKNGYNTDTILVATVNLETKHIRLLSVPRDTRVSVKGSHMKINAVYSYASLKGMNDEETLIKTVSDVTAISINYYMIISLQAFRDIVDALGGVDYYVSRDYKYDDPAQDLHIDLHEGQQILNGEQAEGLVRFRHDYPRADLERVEVQRDFIMEMIKQKLNIKNIMKAPSIYKTVSDNVISNLKLGDIIDYGKAVRDIGGENLESVTLPGVPKMMNGVSYFVADEDEVLAMSQE